MLITGLCECLKNLQFTILVEDDSIVVRVDERPPAVEIEIVEKIRKIKKMYTIHAYKKRTFNLKIKDKDGHPAKVEGIPVWSVAPEGGVALFPTSDGLSCDVPWLSPVALQTLTVTADADLGAGIRTITATADIQTLDAEAQSLDLTAGDETDA